MPFPAKRDEPFFMRVTISARCGRSDGLVLASSLISSYSGTECIGGAVYFAWRSTLYLQLSTLQVIIVVQCGYGWACV